MSYERTLRTEVVRLRRLLRRCLKILDNELKLRGGQDKTYRIPIGTLCDDVDAAVRRRMPRFGRRAGFRCSRETADQFPQSGHSVDDFEAVADIGPSGRKAVLRCARNQCLR